MYWVTPVPEGGINISDDGKTAVLQLKGVDAIDQPKWPKFKAEATPAKLNVRIVWKALDNEKVIYDDPQKQFRFTGYKAVAQMEASVDVPSIGFSWKSDPVESATSSFAIIGEEVNGKYYTS